MSATFEAMGFAHEYGVTFNPEVPAGGEWNCPSFAYGRNGALIQEFDFESRWGTPLVLRVEPVGGTAWVGAFAAGGLGVVRNVYACPSPRHMCVVVDGLAYLVNVDGPEAPAAVVATAVVNVLAVPDVPLLVLAGDRDLSGVGDAAAHWSTPRLVVDDLRVLRASAEAIVCSGDVGGRMATITVTPTSGAVWGSDYR